MIDYIKLIRVKHWIKNALIFIPLITSGFLTRGNFWAVVCGTISFCFMSSVVYIINDIKDIEKDKLHFRKKNRPLASGKIKKKNAIITAIIMFILSIVINTIVNKSILNVPLYFMLGYMVVNLAYSFGLKNVAIIDVVLLASGFIIRIYYGASIIGVEVSNWLFLTILNASLFLGLSKRKKEIVKNKDSRKVLEEYNEAFLDKFSYLTLTLTLVFYSLWATNQSVKYLYLTIPLLMIIFMKYSLYIEKSGEGDPTTILYEDKILLILCLIYALSMILLLVVL